MGLNFAGVGGNDAFPGTLYKTLSQPRIAIVASFNDDRTPITGLLSNPLPNGFASPSGSSAGANTFLGRDFNHWTTGFKISAIDQFSLCIQFQVNRPTCLLTCGRLRIRA